MRVHLLLLILTITSCGQENSSKQTIHNDTVNKSTIQRAQKKPFNDSVKMNGSSLAKQVDKILNARRGNKWHVLNDREARWIKGQFDYFITPKRKEDPDYPYIAKGDFNGDGKTDIAAMVTDKTKRNYLVVVIMDLNSYAGKITYWKDEIIENAALSTFPKTTIDRSEGEKSKKIRMKGDGINVEYFEQSSFVIYWDGKALKRVQTGD